MGLFNEIYAVVKEIPKGKVATYGQIARISGHPRCSRQVGWALHMNPEFGDIPCHRVVNRFGSLCESFAFGGADIQKHMLEDEGVEISKDFKVDLDRFLWKR